MVSLDVGSFPDHIAQTSHAPSAKVEFATVARSRNWVFKAIKGKAPEKHTTLVNM